MAARRREVLRGGARPGLLRVRSHCRFRNRGTEYVSEYGIKWMSGSTTRQRDGALRSPRSRTCPRCGRRPAPAPPRRPRARRAARRTWEEEVRSARGFQRIGRHSRYSIWASIKAAQGVQVSPLNPLTLSPCGARAERRGVDGSARDLAQDLHLNNHGPWRHFLAAALLHQW